MGMGSFCSSQQWGIALGDHTGYGGVVGRRPRNCSYIPSLPPQSPPKVRRQQMDLISELKRKQQKEPLIYESDRDGAIEDIITGEGLAETGVYLVCPPVLPPATSPP